MIVYKTLTNNRLKWQSLLPDVTTYQEVFDTASQLTPLPFAVIQPRLENALALFCNPQSPLRFMLIKAQEIQEHLALIANAVQQLRPYNTVSQDIHYVINSTKISVESNSHGYETFLNKSKCVFQEWVEPEQLFGCVRCHNYKISLHPGLVHQANGGVLMLSVHALLTQPLLWLRLKQMIIQRKFYWISLDETRPLPIAIPPIPLELRLIIVGDLYGLASFSDLEPELSEQAIYGEYEDILQLKEIHDMSKWCGYVNSIIVDKKLPALSTDAWPLLIMHAVRYSGDQNMLPLSALWIHQQLTEATLYTKEKVITANAITSAMNAREWREGYLVERMQYEIEIGHILIETEGEKIGQINGLSVLDYLGYPRSLGEPSRISCVVYLGDGELTDVERKAELGGNLHAKSMMIMQAFLISELKLEHPFPFSASIVFEQSYGEIDGDSASLAELCALMSALSQKPIKQQIAVTGSIDQFGNVQPIGGINEKVEGFFKICLHRGLTGNQGVIFPSNNASNLCLRQEVVNAVREGQFHLWSVNSVAEALVLLTEYTYSDAQQPNLLSAIRDRIEKVNSQERRCWPWLFRWLSYFNLT